MKQQLRNAMADVEKIATGVLREMLTQNAGKSGMTVRAGGNITRNHIQLAQARAEQIFDQHIAQLQNAGRPTPNAAQAREQWKAHIASVLQRTSDRHGWKSEIFGAFRFDPRKGPESGMQPPSPMWLRMVKSNISGGAMGSVSIFENGKGDCFIGKRITAKAKGEHEAHMKRAGPYVNTDEHPIDDLLEHEWAGFRKIQEEAGPHPNLVHAYGIGRFGDEEEPTLLMDYVPGMSGTETFKALRRCLDARRISHAEYSEAIKFIIGRLLDVAGHMARAGVVHLDIKPDNFLINEKSGEPILIDPGLWAAAGSRAARGSPSYSAPEVRDPSGKVGERSDVFAVAATLVQAREGYSAIEKNGRQRHAREGLRKDGRVIKDARGNAVRQPGVHATDTAYTRFLASALAESRDAPAGARRGPRPDSAQAKELEFLADRMLDDDATKVVLKKAMTLAREEAKKPEGEQWRFRAAEKTVSDERFDDTQRMLNTLWRTPEWKIYADLQHYSRTDPALKKYFDERGKTALQPQLEKGAAHDARQFIERSAGWADAVRFAAGWSPRADALPPQPAIRSGVNADGVRLKTADKDDADMRSVWAAWAQEQVAPHVALDELRAYAAEAEVFLRDVETLGPLRDPALKAGIERIRQLALDARRVLAVSGAGANRDEPPAPRGGPAPQLSLDQLVERMAEKRRAPGVSRPDAQGSDTPPQSGGRTR